MLFYSCFKSPHNSIQLGLCQSGVWGDCCLNNTNSFSGGSSALLMTACTTFHREVLARISFSPSSSWGWWGLRKNSLNRPIGIRGLKSVSSVFLHRNADSTILSSHFFLKKVHVVDLEFSCVTSDCWEADHEYNPKITAIKNLATKTCLCIHWKPGGFDYIVEGIIY